MTRCLLKWHEVTKKLLSSHMKLNHTPCRYVLAVCIMTRSGFISYGLMNYDSYKSKSLHWMRSKFIGSNRPCLKWEKAIFVSSFHNSWNIYPLQSHFELIEYFFHKKPWLGSHPTLGAMRVFFLEKTKTMLESMDQREGLEQKSNDWERARRRKPKIDKDTTNAKS